MKYIKLGLCISLIFATSAAQAAPTPLLKGTLNDQAVFSHTYTTTGASFGNQTVWGGILANQDITPGAGAKVSGSTQSGGAVTIGMNATVNGTVQHGTDLVVSARASTGEITNNTTPPPASTKSPASYTSTTPDSLTV